MRLEFSSVAGRLGDSRGFRESEPARQSVMAKATGTVDSGEVGPLSAETTVGLTEMAGPRRPQAFEQGAKTAGTAAFPAAFARSPVETTLDRVADRPASASPPAPPARSMRERLRRPLMLALPIALAVFVGAYYLAEEPYVSTDDAFIRAGKITVNARVAGQAVEIAVHDNELVRQGQVLFRIDPEPYQIAVDQAEARLGSARLQIEGLKATYSQQQAELQSAKDSAAFDEREYDRKKTLVASDFTPRQAYDQAETNLKVARQHVASIEQQIAGTVVALDDDPNIEIDRHPIVRAAKAQLDRARLDLSYATVTAPDDGVVTRVDDLQVGSFVNAGAAVFSLLSSRRMWIEANFRETSLTHMRPGQEATIDVDAYPDRTFRAHIVSMSPGTLDPKFRPEGTALFNLSRVYGSTIGTAVVQIFFYSNTQAMHLALAKNLAPFRAAAHVAGSIDKPALAALNEMITQQAAVVAIIDQFKILMLAILIVSPLALLLRKPQPVN